MRGFASLRRQSDFDRLRRRGRRVAAEAFTLYRDDALPNDVTCLVGVAVSKAVGTAVVRNRIRRRVAAILHDALPKRPPMRLLVVARPAAATASFAGLQDQMMAALR
jgi:ribonuclease P protein component